MNSRIEPSFFILSSSKSNYLPSFLILSILVLPFVDATNVFSLKDGVIKTITVGDRPSGIDHNPDNGNMYVTNLDSNSVSVIGNLYPPPSPLNGTLGSGNNVNIQVQENTGNIVVGQSDDNGNMYSDSPIFQG